MYFDGRLTAIGTWKAGYRPTKLRVTFEVAEPLGLTLRDVNLTTILDLSDYVSGTAAEIPEFTEDIGYLAIGGGGGNYLHITNIEFYPEP